MPGLERGAGDRAGLAPAEALRPAEQHVLQAPEFRVHAPGRLGGVHSEHHPDRSQRPVARAADEPAVGEGVGDVGHGRAGQPLARAARWGRRADRPRGTRPRSCPRPPRRARPPGARGRRREGRARAGPRAEARRRRRRSLEVALADLLDRVLEALRTSRSAEAVAVSPMPNTATITFSEKSSRTTSSFSRISSAIRCPVAPVPRTSTESLNGSQAATLVRPARRSSSTSRPGISRTRSRVFSSVSG